METGEDDDPSDDVTHWVGNLPQSSTYSSKRTDKRTVGRAEQPDFQRKKLPVAKRKET